LWGKKGERETAETLNEPKGESKNAKMNGGTRKHRTEETTNFDSVPIRKKYKSGRMGLVID